MGNEARDSRATLSQPMSLAVLIAWIPLGAWLFRRFPVRLAILVNFFGGWALLPGANYTPSADNFPYWIMGVCLPANYFLTKATSTAIAAAAGILIFHFKDWKTFRPTLAGLPMVVWCCIPLLSAASHRSTLREGLLGSLYQSIAWGVPWLLGRRYFSDYGSLLLAAQACVIAAACYIPVCLVELVTGPQLYALLYGYQPYRWVGAGRYLGYRPIGFLEDGNQLGIWMAAASLIAVSLALRRLTGRILGLPPAWIAAGLAIITLLGQSAGSIILLLILLPMTLLKSRSVLRTLIAALILGIVAFALFRMTGLVSLRALAQSNRYVHALAEGLTSVGRHSLVWRLARDEGHMRMAMRHPLLGWGQWNWWQTGEFRPWGLWLLVFGMYGLVGLAALAAILFLPVLRTVWPSPNSGDVRESSLRLALVGLILMAAFDGLLNSALILPYLLLMGGLAGPRRETRSTPGASRTLSSATPPQYLRK